MSHLSDSQIDTLKRRLTEEKNELERHFEINETSGETLRADAGGELSAYDNHPADAATETFERERDHAIDENLDQKLSEVQAALQRIGEGSYGHCELCREPISYERLEALPWASTCLEHAGLTGGAARSSDRYEMTAPVMPDDVDAMETLESYGSAGTEAPNPREG